MAKAGEIVVETTQPRNSAPLFEHVTEDKCADGVGGSTPNHIATPSDSHKRPGGSSPGKVTVNLTLIFFQLQSVEVISLDLRMDIDMCVDVRNGLVGNESSGPDGKTCKAGRRRKVGGAAPLPTSTHVSRVATGCAVAPGEQPVCWREVRRPGTPI